MLKLCSNCVGTIHSEQSGEGFPVLATRRQHGPHTANMLRHAANMTQHADNMAQHTANMDLHAANMDQHSANTDQHASNTCAIAHMCGDP